MKKKFSMFSLIIGLGFIAWGASVILRSIWGIDIPIFKPLIGLIVMFVIVVII
jgi:hypothetical protein